MMAATLGKNLASAVPNGAMVSDYLAFTKAKSCRQHDLKLV